MASSNQPEILLLCLEMQSYFDQSYPRLIDALTKSAKLKRAKTDAGALRYLESSTPNAVLVTDQALSEEEHSAVLAKIKEYTTNGGLVMFALHMPNFTNIDTFEGLFGTFGLSWSAGDYHRTTFQFNPSSILPVGAKSNAMSAPYSSKVLHIKNARPEEKLYIPVEGAQTQSLVFPPAYVDQTQAATVGAKVGDGYVAYLGDVNPEEGCDKIILALCGL